MTGDLPGTLRYMSPEQALGKRALVDRRTDIYCAGRDAVRAIDPATGGRRARTRQEILRRIAEEEPEPIRRLNPAVPVDLATIVTKALSKDPSNRYETAWQLGRRPGRGSSTAGRSRRGRSGRWREPGGGAGASRRRRPWRRAWFWPLVGGFAGITWNWREAVTQRGLASAERDKKEAQRALAEAAEKRALAEAANARAQSAKADAINAFLIEKLLGQASPMKNPDATRVTLRAALDRAVAGMSSSFRDQPDIEAALRMAMGKAYHDLGEYSKCEALYRKAFEIRKGRPGGLGNEGIEAASQLGHALWHLDRFDDASPLLIQAVEHGQRMLGLDHPTTLLAMKHLAYLRQFTGKLAEAEGLLRHVVREYNAPADRQTPRPWLPLTIWVGPFRSKARARKPSDSFARRWGGNARSTGPSTHTP